jgi:hypothetical protein
LRADAIQFAAHLLQAGASARDHSQKLAVRRPRIVGIQAQGNEHIHPGLHHPEARRQHTHHGVRLVAQADRLARDCRVAAEPALPQGMAQQDEVGVAGLVLLAAERPPHDRLHSQQREEIRRDALPLQFLGVDVPIGSAGQIDVHTLEGPHLFHGAACLLPRLEIDRRDRQFVSVLRRILFPNHQQTLRIAKRQGLQQHRVYDAEYCGSGAHPQRQGEQRDRRESGCLPQQPNPITQILPRKVHGLSG